jgi:glycosyltransferase involved in cell wall biosynthesis
MSLLRKHAEERPSWAVPPVRPVARPSLVAAVAVSDRLRLGLAGEWKQREVTASRLAVGGADLLLVEVSDGTVPGFGPLSDDSVAALVAEAARHDVPVVVWATSGRPPSGIEALTEAAESVFAADALDAWQAVAPSARPLLPAASPRVHTPAAGPGERRPARAAVVTSGPLDPTLAGAVATVLARAVRPLQESLDVHRLDDEVPVRAVLPSVLAERLVGGSYADAVASVNRARVLIDGARRSPGDTWAVLEAGAAQTAVVTLPEGQSDPAGLRGEIVARLHQTELRDREALVHHREVLAAHTYSHRVDEIVTALGREASPASRSVSAIVPTNRTHEIDNVLANVGRQAHEDLELVLVLHGLDLPSSDPGGPDLRARAAEHGVRHLTVVNADSTLTLGACLNLGIDASSGDFVAKMDDDNIYGRHYLTDLLNAFESSGAGIVGKWAHYVWLRSTGAVVLRYPDAEHTWERRIQGGSMLFEGDVVRRLRFGDLPRAVDSDILDRSIAEGVKIWSADRFNYVSVRGDDRSAHTWTVSDATFLTGSGRLAFYGDPRLHVEV